MDDAIEILNEIEDIISTHPDWDSQLELITKIKDYLSQKRTEFEPVRGDCV